MGLFGPGPVTASPTPRALLTSYHPIRSRIFLSGSPIWLRDPDTRNLPIDICLGADQLIIARRCGNPVQLDWRPLGCLSRITSPPPRDYGKAGLTAPRLPCRGAWWRDCEAPGQMCGTVVRAISLWERRSQPDARL